MIGTLNIRTVSDLDEVIRRNAARIPTDVGLVVGIPRSGMLPATLIANLLNLPLVDLDGFIEGRIFSSGNRPLGSSTDKNRALIVDDSIATGAAMRSIQEKIKKTKNVIPKHCFLAVYGLEENHQECDFIFETLPMPRIFTWNILNSRFMNRACVDIDGVLCADPLREENDDGEKYRKFIKNASPLFLPKVPIRYLVTSRLEKYRELTEEWLCSHNIRYERLIMTNLPSAKERTKEHGFDHAKNKAGVFASLDDAWVFVESEDWQAKAIAKLSGKTAFSASSGKVYHPSSSEYYQTRLKRYLSHPKHAAKRLRKLFSI